MNNIINVNFDDLLHTHNEAYKAVAQKMADSIDEEIMKDMLKNMISVKVIKQGTLVYPVKHGKSMYDVYYFASLSDGRELNREVVVSAESVTSIGGNHIMVYMRDHPIYEGYVVDERIVITDIIYDPKELTD